MEEVEPGRPSPERAPASAGNAISLRQTFAALGHANYRLWFAGQLVSLMGTWMQTTAQGFLVYQLTHSAAYLGYVGFAAGVPTWLFTLYGGVIADRMPRRTLLVITQTAMMALAFLLAALTFTGLVRPWHIVLLALLLGVANAFDAPTRQAFVVEMVDRQNLTNAIALNATMFNAATAVGPAVAGVTYAVLGPAWCFTINGLSFFAVIAALLRMRLQSTTLARRTLSMIAELRAGLAYVAADTNILWLMGGLGAFSLIGLGMTALMPAWAVEILHGDAATNGWLLSARGIGSLIAGLLVASMGRFRGKGRWVTIGGFVTALLLFVFAVTDRLPLALLALAGVGWGFMIVVSLTNALIQIQVPDELRGRVMGIYTLVFFGLMPVGSLLAGVTATRIGEAATVGVGALILLGFAAWVWLRRPELRRLA
jgi:MFS family permease